MTADREPHYLVVTIDPAAMEPGHLWSPEHNGCEECNDDPFTLTIECPGVSAGRCNLWQECETCERALVAFGDDTDARDNYRDALDETGEAHGEEHQTFGGVPCVESAGCFVIEAMGWGSLDDDLWDIAHAKGPGRFRIDWDGGDIEDAHASLVESAEVTR
jgi:hypothetical protein